MSFLAIWSIVWVVLAVGGCLLILSGDDLVGFEVSMFWMSASLVIWLIGVLVYGLSVWLT